MPDQKELLELILTAEVINLAKAIRAEKKLKNGRDPGDCTTEAIRDIKVMRAHVMQTWPQVLV